MDLGLLINSAAVTATATVVAMGLGVPVGLGLRVLPGVWRSVVWMATVLVLAFPPFFVAGVWMQQVGFAGAWRVGLGRVGDAVLPLALSAAVLGGLLWPLSALAVAGALDRLDPRLIEAHPGLRGAALVRRALWPPARAALGPAVALTAALALGNFAVPSLFQARIWPEAVWVEFSTRFDTVGALLLGWPFLAVSAGFAWLGLRRPLAWPGRRGTAEGALLRERLGGGWRVGLAGACAGVTVSTLLLPLFLAAREERMWTELVPSLVAARPMLVRSIAYGAGAATLVVLGGMLLGRWRSGMGLAPLFFLPGIFPGMLLLEAFGRPPLEAWRGTVGIVFVALTVRYLFLGWWVARRVWNESDPALHELARLQGAGAMWRWRHVVWPGGRGSLVALWYAVYALALWDVETLVLIVPPGGDSLALMIFNLLHYGHNPQVSALCFWMGAAALLPLAVVAVVRGIGLRRSAGGLAVLGLGGFLCGCGPGETAGSAKGAASEAAAPAPERLDDALFESVRIVGGRGTGPGRFLKPRSVAVDGEGSLFVVDMTGRVQRFDREGRWSGAWQMPETDNGRAKGMAIAPGGGLWVVEPHYHRVNLYDGAGVLQARWGVHGTNTGEFWFPRAIAPGANGDCFVSEYGVVERVQRFTADGSRCLGSIGGPGNGPGQFNRAEGIGTDARGRLYVADSCNHRIQVFHPDGTWLRQHGKPGQGPGEFGYPYDVRVDAEGRQFVCEFGNSRVQVLDGADRPLTTLSGAGKSGGRMNNPWSVCLDGRGHLYVADSLNHRVLCFRRRDGRSMARYP